MSKFEYIKYNLRSADMILCSGNYPVSNIIKEVTNSEYSHVGLLYYNADVDDWFVMESVESVGVRCVPFVSEYLKSYGKHGEPYDGRIDIVRKTYPILNPDQIQAIFKKAFSLIGKLYNNDEIMDITKRIIFNKHSGHPVDHGKYICSEYVYFCFKAAGINLYYDDRGFISPKNILEDENVELIYRDVR